MPGSPTTPDRAGARTNAPVRFAFRVRNSVGIREERSYAAQWLACTLPCRRFADPLAEACARLGADVGCYSFTVVDSHHLLLAGLPAHSKNLHHLGRQRTVASFPKAEAFRRQAERDGWDADIAPVVASDQRELLPVGDAAASEIEAIFRAIRRSRR